MKNKVYKVAGFLVIVVGFLVLNSCEKEKIFFSTRDTVNELYAVMDDYYYWIDSIPSFDPDNYDEPVDLLEAMRYDLRDKWSYITTKTENEQYYEEGTYVGYGFGYKADSEGNLRITYLYDDSDFNELGIERGWKINKVNGTNVTQDSNLGTLLGDDEIGVINFFEFESPLGDIVSAQVAKKIVTINTVVYKDVIQADSKKVGYFVFVSFIGPSEQELTSLFADFASENIDELVIDLRYNGGGMISIVEHLAGLIAPASVDDQKFLSYVHNNDNSALNESIYFNVNANTLGLDKVYFITSKGSASASEAIINGLEPYITTYIVGDDTYGKPVGMYSFYSRYSDLVYVPISFKLVNKNDFGDYYDGLKADSYVEDDLSHNFGIQEATFSNILNHVNTGNFISLKSSGEIFRAPVKEIRTIKQERGSL